MVEWIKAIKADTRDIPQARKVVDNKPAAAHDRCTLGDGKDQPMSACPKPLKVDAAQRKRAVGLSTCRPHFVRFLHAGSAASTARPVACRF
jgi:hypothetical protein